MQSQSPHQRRQHAARVATVVTAIMFVGWLGTLGMRVSIHGVSVQSGAPSQGTQFANALSGLTTPDTINTLEVSTSTNY